LKRSLREKEGNVIGITSYGFYVPVYRLAQEEIARAWKTRAKGGERAVAKYDEDAITLAACAVLDCAKDVEQIDGLFFGSTTAPYEEKQAAAIIGAIADMSRETRTADFAGSLRSGTIALAAAIDAVKSSALSNAMVAVSDVRNGACKSQFEQQLGDAAVAFTIGGSDVVAAFEGYFSLFSEIYDSWRPECSTFVQSWEERFVVTEGYMAAMEKVISGIMQRYELTTKDFAKVVLYGPDKRSHGALARKLGFDLETQVQDPLFDLIGNSGATALPMMLVAALSEASPDDRILVVNYGDGADAFVLKVTEHISFFQQKGKLKERLTNKTYIDYERYLTWRNLVPFDQPRRPELRSPAAPCLWRERKSVLALYGSKCKQCGTVQYPPQRICAQCRSKDDFEYYKLSDKKGEVFTYALDSLTAAVEQPAIIGVVDFNGGGRLACEVAECEPSEIHIGMPVEMTVRKVGRTDVIQNYFWKARPVR
jgi:hydroxymethylglutaryl-CoA synthase